MGEEEQQLKEKARELYYRLIHDPLPVPALNPYNEKFYPGVLQPGIQEDYWVELVEKLQIK